MRYYTLGNSGLRVPQIALGTMTFGTDWGWGADKDTADAIFNHYCDIGGNFFDTADAYTGGAAEEWLGEFISKRGNRDQAVIATKYSMSMGEGGPNNAGNGRKNIIRSIEQSLKRLNTDYIDLFLMHCWDRITPPEEVIRTFNELVSAGKVRHVGLSNVPAWYASRMQSTAENRGFEPICSLQLEYSLIERSIENEFIPFGTRHGAGIMAWSPLGSGLLSGKYDKSGSENTKGRLETLRGSTNPAFQKFSEHNWKIVEELRTVADEIGQTMASTAIRWVMTRPGIASVIVGATSTKQLKDNLAALDFEIPHELLERLNSVSSLRPTYPYSFFDEEIQGGLSGGALVGLKPSRYHPVLDATSQKLDL